MSEVRLNPMFFVVVGQPKTKEEKPPVNADKITSQAAKQKDSVSFSKDSPKETFKLNYDEEANQRHQERRAEHLAEVARKKAVEEAREEARREQRKEEQRKTGSVWNY